MITSLQLGIFTDELKLCWVLNKTPLPDCWNSAMIFLRRLKGTVTDQTPAGGAIVPNNAEIILYLGAEKSTELCIVPNVVGDSAAAANRKLTDAGLIMSVSGATGGSSASVRAISQSETPGTEVAAGTVVRVQFSDSSVTD